MVFINARQIYAEVKEELSSYFSVGAMDDIMFPIWTEYCLKRLRKHTLVKKTVALPVTNGRAELPDDFDSVRAVWTCDIHQSSVMSPTSVYYNRDIRLTPVNPCDCPEPLVCTCNPCKPDSEYQITYKHTSELLYRFKVKTLLKPGNIDDLCMSNDCLNLSYTDRDTFDISGCNLYTTSSSKVLYIEYYAQMRDNDGNPKVPDEIYITQYIKAYITYKLFKKLLNSTTDESYNQIMQKYRLAEQDMNSAWVFADIESKKQTKSQIRASVDRSHRRFSRVRRAYR